jgi:hypothetical protein
VPVSPWQQLSAELDQWQALGRAATLWWRDDDAVTATPALDRLLGLQQDSGVPLALAVIPALAREALARKLEDYPRIAVLQHGYAHKNYAGEGERAIELGGERRRDRIVAELQQGWRDLRALFADHLLPVMVPPWNRISAELYPDLHGLGFRALSCFSARSRREAVTGLRQSNCHADLIDWRQGRRFRGEGPTLDHICAHLQARRAGRADAREATGVLTHHLVHDDACWRFLDTLLERCNRHPGAHWLETEQACLAQ